MHQNHMKIEFKYMKRGKNNILLNLALFEKKRLFSITFLFVSGNTGNNFREIRVQLFF